MSDRQANRQTDSDAGQWMSYAQLAEIRGITKKAAQRLTLRHRWRRQPANDGGVLVWVPDDAASPGRQAGGQTDRHDRGSDGLMAGALAALEDAVTGLRGQLDVANTRALRAETAIVGERARADALRDRLNAQSDDLSFVKEALDRSQAEARAARERAEALQREDDARKARGLLARLRAAVRRE